MATDEEIKKAPQSIFVGPYNYNIEYDRCYGYDYGNYGVVLHRSKRILIDPQQSITELPQTILHEALHCLGLVYEIPEWSGHTKDDKGNTTDKINLMATVLLDFIRCNREFIDYLKETE